MKTVKKSSKPKPAPKLKESKSKTVLSVSPSAWMVWEKCALSLQNVKQPFVLERDEYAKAGTLLHEHIESQLKSRGVIETLDGDDAEIVRFAVETVYNEVGKKALLIETKLSVTTNGVEFSGKPDCSVMQQDTVVVVDFKAGWREVEAEGNSQLKIYAHALARGDKKITKWRGVIINARFNSVSYTGGDIDPNYLSNTAKDILDRTKKKQYKTSNHCAYCQRLSTCKMIRDAIAAWIKPGAIDSITREPEKLAEALRLAKPAEKLFETIKKEAQLFMDLGGEIPGTTVEYTAGTRTWPRDLTVVAVADRIGLKPKDMVEESIISPAGAEKKGASKEAVNAIAIRPPRKGFKFV